MLDQIQNLNSFENVFSNLHPLQDNMTLAELNQIHTIGLNVTHNNGRQFCGAFREFLNNAYLYFDMDIDAIDFLLDFTDPQYRNMSNFDNRISELDTDLVRIENDYWNLWLRFIDDKVNYAKVQVLLDWEFGAFGYWTWPGVLIFRCLGQNLNVLTL